MAQTQADDKNTAAPVLVTYGVFIFKKPTLAAWISSLVLIGLCLGLGVWQLQRLEVKEAMIAKMEAAKSARKIYVRDLPEDLQELGEMEYHNVSLPGHFEHEHEFHMVGRRHNGMPGYDIITPFRLEEHGGLILVNRGWVPNERKEPADRIEDPRFDGIIFLTGVLLKPGEAASYLPKNDPEHNVWLVADIDAMSKIVGEKLPPVIVETLNPTPPPNSLPIPRAESNIELRNDHMGYAMTWFSLAFAGFAIVFIYHLHAMKGDEDEGAAKQKESK